MATKYEFAIKKDILNSGKTLFTPVCRKKSLLGGLMPNPWQRIVCIYDRYFLMDLDFSPELDYNECEIHVQGYKDALLQQVQDDVASVEFDTLEEAEEE